MVKWLGQNWWRVALVLVTMWLVALSAAAGAALGIIYLVRTL